MCVYVSNVFRVHECLQIATQGWIQKIELGGGGKNAMASDSEPIMGVWGRSPQWGSRAKPW